MTDTDLWDEYLDAERARFVLQMGHLLEALQLDYSDEDLAVTLGVACEQLSGEALYACAAGDRRVLARFADVLTRDLIQRYVNAADETAAIDDALALMSKIARARQNGQHIDPPAGLIR